jgi:DNA-binding GntR family transcriptional regulator
MSMPDRVDPSQTHAADVHPRHARLAQRIVDAAVTGSWPFGMRLREEELARRLAVSRTPVRGALRLLAHLGIAEAATGRGFVLARAGEQLIGMAVLVPGQPDRELRAALIRDRLASRIDAEQSQVALARQYGVGLPVLQRVLHAMEQEGLVVRRGWRWAFVSTLVDGGSQQASYQLRMMVEPPSLLLPSFRVEPATLAQLAEEHRALLDQLEAGTPEADLIFQLDAKFHETLARWSGNPFVENLVRQQNALRQLIEFKSYVDWPRVRDWCGEHLEILHALRCGDRAGASRLLERHLHQARAAALRLFGSAEGLECDDEPR